MYVLPFFRIIAVRFRGAIFNFLHACLSRSFGGACGSFVLLSPSLPLNRRFLLVCFCFQITIDGDTAISFTEDVIKRYTFHIDERL